MVQRGLFDVDERLAALSRAGDPLERLSAVVDFALFRPVPGQDGPVALTFGDGAVEIGFR